MGNFDGSTNISGGNVSGNQFAAGSQEFSGIVNNITITETKELDNLTRELIQALKEEQDANFDPSEIINAVEELRLEVKQKTVQKQSLQGRLSGINMVMQTIKNISEGTIYLYDKWKEYIEALIDKF